MSRGLLPEQFHIRSRMCIKKNRGVVKMLAEFGIYAHNSLCYDSSMDEYDECFDNRKYHLIIQDDNVSGNYSDPSSYGEPVKFAEFLEIYGQL